jgi:Rrf2 family protein
LKGSLRISEAASLALHTMVFLAGDPTIRYSSGRIARTICVSEAHLAKVLQRLSKVGLLVSVRGPNGGFRLARSPEQITLLDVFEAIDGPFEPEKCLMHDKSCGQMGCLFGDLLANINQQVREYLGGRNLEDVKWVYASAGDRKGHQDETQYNHHR